MADEKEKESSKSDLNETNEDGEILTLSDLLNEQREIDEVSWLYLFRKLTPINKRSNDYILCMDKTEIGKFCQFVLGCWSCAGWIGRKWLHIFTSKFHSFKLRIWLKISIEIIKMNVHLIFQGYIKRQALYACLTCVPESKDKPEKRAGVCLACSYKCHDGHDLIELYTKRNFRCDCGTSKILMIRCKLDANKMEDNDKNTYNQNFSGVYCVCHRPYPDELDHIQDEMIQCVFCEDWLVIICATFICDGQSNVYVDLIEFTGSIRDTWMQKSPIQMHSMKWYVILVRWRTNFSIIIAGIVLCQMQKMPMQLSTPAPNSM